MPAAVTGCGEPAPRVLRPRRRHYGAPSGEFAERWDSRSAASSVARRSGRGVGLPARIPEREPELSAAMSAHLGVRRR